MIKKTTSLLVLTLFLVPSNTFTNPNALRTGLRRLTSVSLLAGASYYGLTQDGKKTRATIWEATEKILEKTSEAAENTKEWLSEKFSEQKDEHTTMIKTLNELKKENKKLNRQNAAILSKVCELESVLYQVNRRTQGYRNFPEDNNDEEASTSLFINEETKKHPLNRRGVIVMDTDI